MPDKEARDIERANKKKTPSPKKQHLINSLNTEHSRESNIKSCRKEIFSEENKENEKYESKSDYGHPVYKEISRKNGVINKSDLSTLKKMCKDENIDSAGKRQLIQQRLKTYFKKL